MYICKYNLLSYENHREMFYGTEKVNQVKDLRENADVKNLFAMYQRALQKNVPVDTIPPISTANTDYSINLL